MHTKTFQTTLKSSRLTLQLNAYDQNQEMQSYAKAILMD